MICSIQGKCRILIMVIQLASIELFFLGSYIQLVSHLFFRCLIPSTIWFTSVCGFRVDFFFFLFVCLFFVVVSWDKLKWIFCNPISEARASLLNRRTRQLKIKIFSHSSTMIQRSFNPLNCLGNMSKKKKSSLEGPNLPFI